MEKLMTTREAAEALGVAVQTLYNWRFLRQGPAYICVGRRRFYEPSDIQAFKQERRVDPEARGVA